MDKPKVIVVGSGPPKRSIMDILLDSGQKPEWLPITKEDLDNLDNREGDCVLSPSAKNTIKKLEDK